MSDADIEEIGGLDHAVPLSNEEIGKLRLVIDNLEALESTLHTLTRDQSNLTEAVSDFATRTEHRQIENMNQIKANQALLHEVIKEIKVFATKSETSIAIQGQALASLKA